MSETYELSDEQIYLERMKKALMEKLWFLSFLPQGIHTIVDFGCADGTLLEHLPDTFRKYGIDNNPDFADICQQKGIRLCERIGQVPEDPNECGLLMSSVIHELFTYLGEEETWKLMREFVAFGPKQIYIRDMIYSTDAPVSKTDLANLYEAADEEEKARIEEFRQVWGLETQSQLMHYLLKCKYVENWDRELHENYIPYSYRALLDFFEQNGYRVGFLKLYTNEYIKGYIKEDYNIELTLPTHMLLMVEKIEA